MDPWTDTGSGPGWESPATHSHDESEPWSKIRQQLAARNPTDDIRADIRELIVRRERRLRKERDA